MYRRIRGPFKNLPIPSSPYSLLFPCVSKTKPHKNIRNRSMAEIAETTATVPVPEPISTETNQTSHKLERKWTFWLDNQLKPKQGAAWGATLREIYTFDTVEEFWCLHDQIFRPSKLPGNADFQCFRTGIAPKWEDPECANGGKWTIATGRKTTLDTMWLETLLALIGEQFDEIDEICGVVASVRQRGDRVSLWTKSASNESIQMSIGKKWKEILDVTEKIPFTSHNDSRSRDKSSRGEKYHA